MPTSPGTEEFSRFFEPNRHAAMAMLSQMERLAHLQMDTTRRCADLYLDQCRAMLAIHDGPSLSEFAERQQRFIREIGEAVTDELRTLGDLNRSFATEMEQVGRESAEALRTAEESMGAQHTQ